MPETATPPEMPGLRVKAPAELMDDIEALTCIALDEDIFQGTSRMTWYDPKLLPIDEAGTEPEALQVYLSPKANMQECAKQLRQTLAPLSAQADAISVEPLAIPERDWATLWRDFFRPIRVSESLLILPAWWDRQDGLRQTGLENTNPVIVRIEPGQAFGSGTHATTRLCLRMLEKTVQNQDRVLDFGAGSGILSFAIAPMHPASCLGVEIDPEARDNFELNAKINHEVAGHMPLELRIGSSEVLSQDDEFDLIVCNALFHRVSDHFPTLIAHLAPKGRFLYSGYLSAEKDTVQEHFTHTLGLNVCATQEEEEWSALLATR